MLPELMLTRYQDKSGQYNHFAAAVVESIICVTTTMMAFLVSYRTHATKVASERMLRELWEQVVLLWMDAFLHATMHLDVAACIYYLNVFDPVVCFLLLPRRPR